MMLPDYATRCGGQQCPSKTNCKRYTERNAKEYVTWAAFWARRDPSASACDMYAPVEVVTTFKDLSWERC